MRIKRLRLTGFKSFVDPSDLRIERGLTGVVGPNGCGKSNLLEALRWTMGENSPKSMRGAGMEDVIFAGTATRPPRDFAEVSLLAEDADGGEVEVVRRIERGAGSAYRIDGRDVRARDVQLLFADAATGAHSPALVSQNRIGAVIAAKPGERRQMLEEAAGIAGLHVRRKEAEMRLRATEANLARLDEVMADVEARAAALRRQARAAERYRAVSERIRTAEARLIWARWRDAAQAADAAKAEAATAAAQVAAATDALAAATATQAAATGAIVAARAAAQDARDRANDAGHRLSTLRAQQAATDRRIADLADQHARIRADGAREGDLARDAAAALARLGAEAKALDAAIAEGLATIPALDAAQRDAERDGRDAEVALAQALGRQATEAAEARVAAAALSAARTRLDRAIRDAAQVAQAAAALPAVAPLETERTAAAARREAALAEGQRAAAALAWAEEGEAAAQAARDPADAARAAALADLAALDSEAAALRRATQRIEGRLIDDIRVDPGFERALAAALGDDLESAAADWHGSAPDPADPPAPVGTLPLADRIAAPATLARRLSQIFVVEVDSGQSLLPGQRLVTRDGRLRRWDGFAMDGGGAAAAGRLERLNRLGALDAARPAAQARVDAADAARTALSDRLARTRAAVQGARALIRQHDVAARDAQRDEDRAAATLDRLTGQRADLDARATRTAADLDDARADHARAEAIAAALPDGSTDSADVARRRREAERSGVTVAAARAARTTLDRTLAGQRDRLAATQAEGKDWRVRAGEAATRIADMDRHAAALATEAAAIADRPATLANDIAALEADHAAMRIAADTLARAERDADAALRDAEGRSRAIGDRLTLAREARAGAAARVENHELRRVEMGRVSGERFGCPAPVLPTKAWFDSTTVGAAAAESAAHERLMLDRERIGPVNLVAERELADMEAAATGNAAERDDLGQAVDRLRGSIGTLNREGRVRLLAAFEAVDGHFRRLFATLFDGGQAHLALIDSDDPLEAGLEIMAQPPGKRLSALTLLSGGEQALTAVALIFGLFLTNPAPICVLDEVDAPLDDANIERFCDLLDRMTQETDTRYLIVTHNAVTMSRMHRLFGVTMIERGVSRLVSVDLQAAAVLAAE